MGDVCMSTPPYTCCRQSQVSKNVCRGRFSQYNFGIVIHLLFILSFSICPLSNSVTGNQPEGCHHLVVWEVLVVIFVDGVSTGLCIGPPSVLVSIESKLQVFGKRHGPWVVGQRHHRCHLKKEADSESNSSSKTLRWNFKKRSCVWKKHFWFSSMLIWMLGGASVTVY